MRASYLRWNRSSTASNVTFELGFSLAGPSAHNIEKYSDESDRIRAHNDGDLGTTPAVNYSDFGELDIWEPIEQAIDSIGEERETASDSPQVSASVPTKGDKKQEGGEQLVSGAFQIASKAGKGVSDLSAALDASDELLATIKLEGDNNRTEKHLQMIQDNASRLQPNSVPKRSTFHQSLPPSTTEPTIPLPTPGLVAPAEFVKEDTIVRVNKKSVEPEKEKQITPVGKKVRVSPINKKEQTKEKKKDVEVQCLTIAGLKKLNPNSNFQKEQFPESFFQLAPDVEILEETLQWASVWLARRLEKREYFYAKGMLPIEKMLIHIAFNQLSNAQLEDWMDAQRQKIMALVTMEMETGQGKVEQKSEREPDLVKTAKQEAAEKECR